MAAVVSLFNPAQTTAFFTEDDQIGLSIRSYNFILDEGFGTIESLYDMSDDVLQTIIENARRPPAIADPANANQQVAQLAFPFSATSIHRLKVAHRCIKYYALIGRTITPLNLTWPILQIFHEHWQIIDEQKEKENAAGPKVGKDTQNLSYFEDHFEEWCDTNVGLQGAKYKYVIRADPTTPLPLAVDQPFSAEYGSVEEELAAYCTHNHPRFKQDNATVFTILEKALRHTTFYSTLRPFSRSKNGRDAWIALRAQYLGEDKRRAEIREVEDILNNREWKGVSSYKLEKYASLHRWCNERLKQIAEHTDYQLPDTRRQVERFITNIKSSDPELMAAVAQVKADKRLDGPLYNFEDCVAALLPSCPVSKRLKRSGNTKTQHVPAHIAAFVTEETNTQKKSGGKYETGTTGVVFRHYDKQEYSQLSNEQKNELRLWRSNKKGNATNGEKGKKRSNENADTNVRAKKITRKQMKSMVSEVMAQYKSGTADVSSNNGDVNVSSLTSSSTTNAAPTSEQIAGSLRRNLEQRNKSN